MRYFLFFLFALNLFTASAQSTFTSDGPIVNWATGPWLITGAADGDGIPDSNDDIVVLSGHEVRWSGNRQCLSIQVNAGGTLRGPLNAYTGNSMRIFSDMNNEGNVLDEGEYYLSEGGTLSGDGLFDENIRFQFRRPSEIANDVTLRIIFPGWIRIVSANLTNRGKLTLYSGGTISAASPSTKFSNRGELTIGTTNMASFIGSFRSHFPGSSVTMRLYPGGDVPIPDFGYYDLDFEFLASSYTVNSDLVVLNDLSTATSVTPIDFNGNDLYVGGDWDQRNSNISNLGTVFFDGTNQRLFTGNGFTNTILPGNWVIEGSSSTQIELNVNVQGDLTINGSLDVTTDNHEIYLSGGDWINNGSFNAQEGLVLFNNSVAQTIDGTQTFHNLTINNAGGVSMNSGTSTVNRRLSVDPSGFLNANGRLILNSTATTDAWITANSTVNGNITVRRFIPAGAADYRDLGSPVSGATIADWDNEITISGPSFPDGCAYGGTGCFTSIATWNAATQAYTYASGPGDNLSNGTGFEVFLGDNLNAFSGIVMDVTGGNVNGSTGNLLRSGWNLIANPFPSVIDFNDIFPIGGVGNYFYIYDQTTGGWEFYDGTGGSSGAVNANGFLASGQGFWVFSSGLASLIVDQADKEDQSGVTIVKDAGLHLSANTLNLNLSDPLTERICRAQVKFRDDVMNDPVAQDIMQFRGPVHLDRSNTAPLLSLSNENGDLVRKDVRTNADELQIPVTVTTWKPGKYVISTENLKEASQYSCILLFDQENNTYHNLKEGSYSFLSQGNGADDQRFTLILTRSGSCVRDAVVASGMTGMDVIRNDQFIQVSLSELPENKEGRLMVMDMTGRVVADNIRVANEQAVYEIYMPDASGVYMVIMDFGDERITKKVVF